MKPASFTCWLCGRRDDQLPYPQGLDFARMQQHAMDAHGLTLEDLDHTHREEFLHGTRWLLPNGEPWLQGMSLLI